MDRHKWTHWPQYFVIIILILCSSPIFGQQVYKTPTGDCYHKADCVMVENVSRALTVPEAVEQYHLRPCSFCKPPQFISKKNSVKPKTNKAVGTARTRRCQGLTKKGLRCKHRTSLSNGFCYQHVKQPDH